MLTRGYAAGGGAGGGGVADHAALTGLEGDDHPQYTLRADMPEVLRALVVADGEVVVADGDVVWVLPAGAWPAGIWGI